MPRNAKTRCGGKTSIGDRKSTRLNSSHSLKDALPIYFLPWLAINAFSGVRAEEIVLTKDAAKRKDPLRWEDFDWRSEEHTSELQSLPKRRSSDLLLAVARHQRILWRPRRRDRPDQRCRETQRPVAVGRLRLEIGRAHV